MSKRKIIKIDEEKCNGCGLCMPNCPEGALQMIDGKARLVSDLFCDGLGACIGYCPEGEITIEEREAEPYDEKKVMQNIIKQGENVIVAHLKHLKEHGEDKLLEEAINFLKDNKIEFSVKNLNFINTNIISRKTDEPDDINYIDNINNINNINNTNNTNLACGCPGSAVQEIQKQENQMQEIQSQEIQSQLRQWPIQIKLVPPFAPYLKNANILVAADCVPFAYSNFHRDFLKGKILLIGCPKLDDFNYYKDKMTQIFKENDIKSVTCVHMEVPCCFGLVSLLKNAISDSGKNIPLEEITISTKGQKL